MPDPTPQPAKPGEPAPDPAVYGGHWGPTGSDAPATPPPDRPAPIAVPDEPDGKSEVDDRQD
jgi:hypothetical protein